MGGNKCWNINQHDSGTDDWCVYCHLVETIDCEFSSIERSIVWSCWPSSLHRIDRCKNNFGNRWWNYIENIRFHYRWWFWRLLYQWWNIRERWCCLSLDCLAVMNPSRWSLTKKTRVLMGVLPAAGQLCYFMSSFVSVCHFDQTLAWMFQIIALNNFSFSYIFNESNGTTCSEFNLTQQKRFNADKLLATYRYPPRSKKTNIRIRTVWFDLGRRVRLIRGLPMWKNSFFTDNQFSSYMSQHCPPEHRFLWNKICIRAESRKEKNIMGWCWEKEIPTMDTKEMIREKPRTRTF